MARRGGPACAPAFPRPERGTRLYREVISGTSLTSAKDFFNGDVRPTPHGRAGARQHALWLTTTNYNDKDSIANNSNEKIFKVALGG